MINSYDYKYYADSIANQIQKERTVASILNELSEELASVDETSRNSIPFTFSVELSAEYNLTTNERLVSSRDFEKIVRSLQEYIFRTYGDVNTFIRDADYTVDSDFAEVSERVGFPIDSDLIG